MGGTGRLSGVDHATRATEHHATGDVLCRAGDDWAAVCYFYASLHRLKAALLKDPIFHDPIAMAAKNSALRPDDRFCDKHRGRSERQADGTYLKSHGLIDLAGILYPTVDLAYSTLFTASLDVRYKRGLTGGLALPIVRVYAEQIQSAYTAGALVTS